MTADSTTHHIKQKDGMIEIPITEMVNELDMKPGETYKLEAKKDVQIIWHVTVSRVKTGK